MKLHHTKYKDNYKRYILDCVNNENETLTTDEEKINYIFNRFYSEYYFGNIALRYGKQKAMSDWIAGLSLNLPYYNSEIIELAIEMGSIDENPSDKLQAKVLENYWEFMANVILGFEPKKEGLQNEN
jgi:hypothetical protein